jgi:hypothetical protein
MTEPPLLARALLRVAELLTPATDRLWVDAMRGDLDAAHAEGRALSWALGCLMPQCISCFDPRFVRTQMN